MFAGLVCGQRSGVKQSKLMEELAEHSRCHRAREKEGTWLRARGEEMISLLQALMYRIEERKEVR